MLPVSHKQALERDGLSLHVAGRDAKMGLFGKAEGLVPCATCPFHYKRAKMATWKSAARAPRATMR